MKKILPILLLLAAVAARAQTTNVINYQVVNGTVSNTIPISNFSFPPQTFIIQSGPITNAPVWQTNVVFGATNVVNLITNAQTVKILLSFDNTNFAQVATWNPDTTNSAVSVPTINLRPSVYMQVKVVTTNPIPASVFRQ